VRLSTRGRYAVMAMADLALCMLRASGGTPVKLAEIAARQGISLAYLEQLFAQLRRAGLVCASRGPGGGYRLAQPAGETCIADIVLAVDEPIRATRCQAGGATGCLDDGSRCLTHDLWEELGNRIHLFLASVSLEDLVAGRVPGRAWAPPAQQPVAGPAE
jgi:Rrf2 family iron-sulfur cluster assembly transcriptional regulator